jgi:hypothetical protein
VDPGDPAFLLNPDPVPDPSKTELSKTIFFSNFLKSKFESNQIKNTRVIHQKFCQKVVTGSAI